MSTIISIKVARYATNLNPLRPRDRDDIVTLGEEPCKGDLPRCHRVLIGDLLEAVRELENLREVLP